MTSGTAHDGLDRDADLILEDVSYHVDSWTVLDGISLRVRERRSGIVGLNGSGKTTLARLICGLVKPTCGRITINGIDVASDRRAALGLVGLVFQNPDHQIIFPTVEEEISFGLVQKGLSKAEAAELSLETLAGFGRRNWAGRPVASLSQGQRHLVCIMAVAAMRPSLLVLDEPFSGPDIPTIRQLHRQLDRLDVAQILITHDLQYLQDHERVIWLDKGRVRGDGTPGRVLAEFTEEIDRMSNIDAFAEFSGQNPVS